MAEQPQTTSSTSEQPSSPSLHKPSYPSQMFPIMALVNAHQNQEHGNRGVGLYAVPYSGPVVGFPTNNLIPLTYNVPTRTSTEASATATGEEHGQQQHPNQQAVPQQRQVVVVRRFQIAFQLDILLILKLAAVIFLFNQEGSRQRLAVLVFFASLVYLYQTGALTPLVRWLSQGMYRAAHQPRPAVRPENVGPPVRPGNAFPGDELGGAENENRAGNNGDQAVQDENLAEPERGNRWWGILKEIQMIVFGFITSLLPGFHNID